MMETTETPTVYAILALAGRLSMEDRRHVADLLSRENDTPLPNHATSRKLSGCIC